MPRSRSMPLPPPAVLAVPSVRRSTCLPVASGSAVSVTASDSTCRSRPPSTRMIPRHWTMGGALVEPAYLGSTGNYVVEEEHVVSNGRLSRISPEAPRNLIEI